MINKIWNVSIRIFFFIFIGILLGASVHAIKNQKNAISYEKMTKDEQQKKDDEKRKTTAIILMAG